MSIQVFISHASEDYRYAKRLFESLSAVAELRPWLDRSHLLPGMEWEEEIFRTMEASQFIVLVLSTRSVGKSGFVQREFEKAVELLACRPPDKLFLVPVRLDECQSSFPEVKRLQFVDLFPTWEAGVARVRKAMLSQMREDVGVALEQLRRCSFSGFVHEQAWVHDHGDAVLELGVSAVIEACDRSFSVYGEELYALSVLMQIASKNRTSDLTEFAYRVHEIVKLCGHAHEISQFYGYVFWAASLLSPRCEAAYLRTVFDYYLEHSADFYRGTWWADLALRDMAKHHMATEASEYVSGVSMRGSLRISQANVHRSVVERTLAHLTWDIAAMDILVYYCFRTGEALPLLDVIESVRRGFSEGTVRSRPRLRLQIPLLPSPDRVRSQGPSNALRITPNDLSLADSREDFARVGILLRAGEYLTYSGQDNLTAYGISVREAALQGLDESNPRLTAKVREMSRQESREFFSSVEHVDYPGLSFFLEDEGDQQAALSLVRKGPHYYQRSTQSYLRTAIRRVPGTPANGSDQLDGKHGAAD